MVCKALERKLKEKTSNRLYGILFLIVAMPMIGQAQQNSSEKVIDSILVCLETHDAITMVKHMNDPVDIKIDEKKGIYSLSQAKVIIRNFFKQHPFTSFTKNHTSESGSNEVSVIGTYTSDENVFRFYFLLKKNGEGYRIYQFYVEKS